jgi:hypothetical protein
MNSVKSADVLNLLSPERLEMFRKTDLFKHFEAELVISKLDKSEIYIEFGDNFHGDYFYFNVFKYNGVMRLGCVFEPIEESYAHVIDNYLTCKGDDLVDFDRDIRYYKDHPYDTQIYVKTEQNWSIIYGDYQYWLMLGNKPRYMYYECDMATTEIPDEIIFLDLEHGHGDIRISTPKQVLFLISRHIDYPDQLIAYYKTDIAEDSKVEEKEKSLIWEAFHDYNFYKRSKSARKI